MKRILVTGGTVFVSKYVAEYFAAIGNEVYVLNRNTHRQPEGCQLIEADRNHLGDCLKQYSWDVVLDITAYTGEDVSNLLHALGDFDKYVLLSSSAVYPETANQPFTENEIRSVNKYWGKYGTDKIDAENVLLEHEPDAIILRPPYLYGPMNNLYREAFVFECAQKSRKFYLPGQGDMNLQFFHVQDLCYMIERLISKKDTDQKNNIYNAGNYEAVTIKDWVTLCYRVVGKEPEFVHIEGDVEQRKYFSFYNYEYILDVTRQKEVFPELIPLAAGLEQSYEWYKNNSSDIRKKDFISFIDANLV